MTIRIGQYFDKWFEMFGNTVHSLGWYNSDTQLIRFDALVTIDNLSSSSVLDVGSGLGDFYKYLDEYYVNIDFTGIDVSDKLVRQARKNYPKAEFLKIDLMDFEPDKQYDYVFASGPFNIREEEQYEYLRMRIEKMWKLAGKGVAFNLLSSYTPEDMRDDFFYFYEPQKVFTICKEFSEFVTLRHDYLKNDMTFIMKR